MYSEEITFKAGVVPLKPVINSITSSTNSISIVLRSQGNSSNNIINNYKYSLDGGSTYTEFSLAQTGTSLTINDIDTSVSYNIVVIAMNEIGDSLPSEISIAQPYVFIPATPPELTYALSGDSSAYIYFKRSTTNTVGETIVGYEYTINDGATWTSIGEDISTPVMISGLTNDTQYSIRLRGVDNNENTSDASNALTVTPRVAGVSAPRLYYDPDASGCYSGSGDIVQNIGNFGAFNGTMINNVEYVTGTGLTRKAFDFNQNISFYSSITFGQYNFGSAFTISAWIYPRDKTSINGLLANTTSNQEPNGFKIGWNTWQANNRAFYFEAGNGISGNSDASVVEAITYDKWQHVTYIIDVTRRVVVFLLNGVPVDTISYSDNITIENFGTTDKAFRIGTFTNGSYSMNAQLGYIKIYNSVLSVADIAKDYEDSKESFTPLPPQ